MVYIVFNLRNTRQGGRCKAAVTKTSPNDARCVVWAITEFFFFFFSIFLILTNVFGVYIGYEICDGELEGSGGESGP